MRSQERAKAKAEAVCRARFELGRRPFSFEYLHMFLSIKHLNRRHVRGTSRLVEPYLRRDEQVVPGDAVVFDCGCKCSSDFRLVEVAPC